MINNDPHLLLSKKGNIEHNSLFTRRKNNNINMMKLSISKSDEEVKLHQNRDIFLETVKKFVNKDMYYGKAETLFDNLACLKYNPDDYQHIEKSRYCDVSYRNNTLIKAGDVLLPANKVSSPHSPYMTIASEYP